MIKTAIKFLVSILKFLGNLMLGFILLGIIYVIIAVVLTYIPANYFAPKPTEGVTLYIKTNGVHTDFVLPMEHRLFSWHELISIVDFKPDTNDLKWIAFGWGNKGFYLDTPEWKDLRVSTALNAMLIPSPTAMHVTLYPRIWENERTRKIVVSEAQYLLLCDYISKSFQRDLLGRYILINCCHYNGANDNFYEAQGSYSLLNTCNNWTNSGLKTIGIKTALWAPFDKCIFHHFKE